MKLYIKTFGCQMNDRDSEALAGLFLEQGYSLAEKPEDADVILVNTCSVREHAENRAISFLESLKKITDYRLQITNFRLQITDFRLQITDSKKIIGLIGCMAKNRGEEIFKKMSHIDLIVGPAKLNKVPEYVKKISNFKFQISNSEKRVRIIDLEDRARNEDFYRVPFRQESGGAQVVISTGCSNYCSYCVVPFVRGPLRLRNPKDIIDEIKRNVALGRKRITLLGQNVNDYNYKLQITDYRLQISDYRLQIINFIDLLKMVEKVDGVEEIDFLTSHPKNTSRELFELMAHSKKIKKHLHLPFQSGSDRILKLMNRGYTKQDYLKLVDDYYHIVKGTLSTDVIVGFPTETESDFLETKEILKKVRFKYAYIFKYSPRLNTLASKLKDDVPEEEKERRHQELLFLQKDISRKLKDEEIR